MYGEAGAPHRRLVVVVHLAVEAGVVVKEVRFGFVWAGVAGHRTGWAHAAA